MTTVENLVSKSTHHKIWLCPSHVSNSTFQLDPLLKGVECTKSTVPAKLLQKQVEKHFVEDNFLCIIWKNDEPLSSIEF